MHRSDFRLMSMRDPSIAGSIRLTTARCIATCLAAIWKTTIHFEAWGRTEIQRNSIAGRVQHVPDISRLDGIDAARLQRRNTPVIAHC